MTRLRFIKPWSTYRPGDTMDTDSPATVERMVRTHGVCVIDAPVLRAFEAPAHDKMVRTAGRAKTRKTRIS